MSFKTGRLPVDLGRTHGGAMVHPSVMTNLQSSESKTSKHTGILTVTLWGPK